MSDKLILLTNDDGILAPGLEALARAASKYGRVVVVAPDRNRSAISSAMSIHNILRLEKISPDRYSCDGTPVDCVLMGVRHVLERVPDWVISGVNWGFNMAEDALYSGTVGAAFEGCLQGIKSAAFSMHRDGNLEIASRWIEHFFDGWEKIELPAGSIWNVNLPEGEPKGFKLTTQGQRTYWDLMEQRHDPSGKPYFWISGEGGPQYKFLKGSDAEATHEGFVSLTPLQMDMSCRATISNCPEFDEVFSARR
jgi:5'-nucleotidase